MGKQKTMTFEEFHANWSRRGSHQGHSQFNELLSGMEELKPVAVTVGNADLRKRQTALGRITRDRFGTGRIRTTIADGVLYACLMPESENSK